jgi:hypothetical protein
MRYKRLRDCRSGCHKETVHAGCNLHEENKHLFNNQRNPWSQVLHTSQLPLRQNAHNLRKPRVYYPLHRNQYIVPVASKIYQFVNSFIQEVKKNYAFQNNTLSYCNKQQWNSEFIMRVTDRQTMA